MYIVNYNNFKEKYNKYRQAKLCRSYRGLIASVLTY